MLCKSCIGLTSQPKLVSREALPMAAKTFTTGLAPDGNAPPYAIGVSLTISLRNSSTCFDIDNPVRHQMAKCSQLLEKRL